MAYYTRLMEQPHSITIKADALGKGLLYRTYMRYPEYRQEIKEWCKNAKAQNKMSLWILYGHGVVNAETTTICLADGRVFDPPHSSTYMKLFTMWQKRLAVDPASIAIDPANPTVDPANLTVDPPSLAS